VFSLVRTLAALLPVASLMAAPVQAKALFDVVEVDQTKFVIVAAPIGTGERAQLNIYEQRKDTRPCFALVEEGPVKVDPLLSSFDFTGICSRYIDGNGYSLRIGGDDLGTRYRLSVVNTGRDIELLATPTKNPSQPTMLVARAGGAASGFVQLKLEPGWTLKRRAYGKKSLGHLYVYRDSAPVAGSSPASEPVETEQSESSVAPSY